MVLPKSQGFTLDTAGTWKVDVKVNGVEVGTEDVYVGDLAALETTTTTAVTASG